ncbi:MAG: hypothetical protein ABH828_05645 [archaeon]
MSLLEIKKIFERRKLNLMRALENGKEDIELSKQHQMYGAIKELENILKTLDYYQELEVKNHFDFRLSNEPSKTFLKRIKLKMQNKNKMVISE